MWNKKKWQCQIPSMTYWISEMKKKKKGGGEIRQVKKIFL